MATEEPWVGIAAVATHLGVGKDTIYRWIDTQGLSAHRVGGLFRFRLSQVDEWIQKSGANEPKRRSSGIAIKNTRRDRQNG
jgi:excisionase family DNA binding protein